MKNPLVAIVIMTVLGWSSAARAQSEYLKPGVSGAGIGIARLSTPSGLHATGTAIGVSARGWFDVGLKGVTNEGTPYPRGFYMTGYPVKQGWRGNPGSVAIGVEYQLSNGESGIDVLTAQIAMLRRFDLSPEAFFQISGSFGVMNVMPAGLLHIGSETSESYAGFGGAGEFGYDINNRLILALGVGVSKFASLEETYSIGLTAVFKLKKKAYEGVPF